MPFGVLNVLAFGDVHAFGDVQPVFDVLAVLDLRPFLTVDLVPVIDAFTST